MKLTDYANTVVRVDASAVKKDLTISGNSKANEYILGTGRTTLLYGVGSNRDVVKGFKTTDKIQITSGKLLKAAAAGSDVYLRYSTGEDVLEVVGMVNKTITIDNQKLVVMSPDRDVTMTYAANTSYYGASNHTDTLRVMSGERIHLEDSRFHNINVLDGRGSSKRVALRGNAGTTTLYGSAYDDDLAGSTGHTIFYGSKGPDRIWCGSGKDTVMYSVGSGRDVVYGFDTAKDKVKSVNAKLLKVGTAGSDVYLRYSTGQDVLQLKGLINKSFLLDGKRVMVMNQNASNTAVYVSGTEYYGAAGHTNTLLIKNGEAARVHEGKLHNINVLDARGSSKSVCLAGGSTTTTLYGSSRGDNLGGSTGTTIIVSGKGNDNLWGSTGKEVFKFSSNAGSDIIHNFDTAKDEIRFTDAGQTRTYRSGNNLVMVHGQTKVTVENGAGKTIRWYDMYGNSHSATSGGAAKVASKNSLSYLYDNQIVSKSSSVASLTPTSSSRGLASQAYASPVTSARKKTL